MAKQETALTRLKDFPTGFWFVFWGELAERASYYGMRTLLALFLLDVLHFDRNHSGQTTEFFIACSYLLPIMGGYVADYFLGKYKTILYFSIPYILGHFFLGLAHTPIELYVALGLLAVGVGGVKPNVSPLMGMIFDHEKKGKYLGEAFSYYYAAINIGGFLTSAALPKVRDAYGYTIALFVPAFAMIISMIIFALGKKYYPKDQVKENTKKSPEQRREERETLMRISGIFALIICFWMVYDQSASTWVFFARDHMDMQLWPFNVFLTPDQVQAYNPFFIVILTPAFVWLWNFLERKTGKVVPATRKMMAGFILTTVCVGAMAFAGLIAGQGKVSVWWEVLATFVVTLSELCVSVVGFELAYRVASPRTKSTVTAAFLFTIFAGDFIGGLLAGFYENMTPAAFFGLQVVVLAWATVAFYFVSKKFDKLNPA